VFDVTVFSAPLVIEPGGNVWCAQCSSTPAETGSAVPVT